MKRSMMMNSSPMGLDDSYGSASNVVRMSPGSSFGSPQVSAPVAHPQAEQYDGAWQWLTDKQYREDYKAARDADLSRSEAKDAAETMADFRELDAVVSDPAYAAQMKQAAESAYKDPNGRELRGKDAYVYWQNPDNSMVILAGPANAGTYYPASHAAAKVVVNLYGEFPSGVLQSAASAAQSGWDKLAQVFQPGPLSQPASQTAQKEDKTLQYVALGVAGVLGLGLIVAIASRNRG